MKVNSEEKKRGALNELDKKMREFARERETLNQMSSAFEPCPPQERKAFKHRDAYGAVPAGDDKCKGEPRGQAPLLYG